jgi:hypothetical protein
MGRHMFRRLWPAAYRARVTGCMLALRHSAGTKSLTKVIELNQWIILRYRGRRSGARSRDRRSRAIVCQQRQVIRTRDGVLEDCPRPRGHLEDKIWRPWPWPRTFLALALASM